MLSIRDFTDQLLYKSERRAPSRLQGWAQRKAEVLRKLLDEEQGRYLERLPRESALEALVASFGALAVNMCVVDSLEQLYRRSCAAPEALPQRQAHTLVDCWGRAQQARALLLEALSSGTPWQQERIWALVQGIADSLTLVTGHLAREGELARVIRPLDWAQGLLRSERLKQLGELQRQACQAG